MQCEVCKNHSATIHMTEIIDGNRTERHLCQDCAAAEGLAVQSKLSLNELLSSLLAAGNEVDAIQKQDTISCDNCGMSPQKFQDEAVLGCPKDYDVFGDGLETIIKRAQDGNSKHIGKVPNNVEFSNDDTAAQQRGVPDAVSEIARLKAQLDGAIKTENYEHAAKLRDKIEKCNETD